METPRKTLELLIKRLDAVALFSSALLLDLDMDGMAGALATVLRPWEKAQRNLSVASCVSLEDP